MLRSRLDTSILHGVHVVGCGRCHTPTRKCSKLSLLVASYRYLMGTYGLMCCLTHIKYLMVTRFQGTGAGLIHSSRNAGSCFGGTSTLRLVPYRTPSHPSHELRVLAGGRCRQSLTVEALGWTEFALCCATLVVTVLWMRSGKRLFVRDSRTFV